MKKESKNPYRYCRVKETKSVSPVNREFTAEANVDNGIESSRSTLRVVREEVINGKRYKVLTVG
ncbi:MAG: hypothetical protein QGH83_16150 [Candidatus Pacebacteria bacterium]|nr:hypothetical protein [Candidatus Paceibacterota bacterium]